VEALETCQTGFGGVRELPWSDMSRGMNKDRNNTTEELQMRTWWRRWNELVTGEVLPPEVKAPLEETFTAARLDRAPAPTA
jgi:p-cumate 2,3-dioxygenase alpha subunit